jgi:DNA-binding protein H-NS
LDELLRVPSDGFDTFEPPVEDPRVHVSVDPEELLGDEALDPWDDLPLPKLVSTPTSVDTARTPAHTERDAQIIQSTLAQRQMQRRDAVFATQDTPPAPVPAPGLGTPPGVSAAQRVLETPGFEGVPAARNNPASVINLVTRGRMRPGERLRAYLADLPDEEDKAVRALMDDYKLNADSPEIVTAMLMGHIVKVAHVIPNLIDLQVERVADSIHGAMAAYASTPKTIDTHIGLFKQQSSESTLLLREELEAFAEAFHAKMHADLTGVMNDYFTNLEKLEELVKKHKQLLEEQAQTQVKESTQKLQETERLLEQKFKKEIGAALITASQSIQGVANKQKAPSWVPYALAAASAGMLLGAVLVALIK